MPLADRQTPAGQSDSDRKLESVQR